MVDAGAFIKQEIEKKRQAEAARAEAATLEERIKPVINSTAWNVIQQGLNIFENIPPIFNNKSKLDASNDAKLIVIDVEGDEKNWFPPRVKLLAHANGEIEVQRHEENLVSPKFAEISTWNIHNIKKHFIGPNEVSVKSPNDQIDLAYSVLTNIGQYFSKLSPAFAEGFEPAMKLIHQTYDPIKADAVEKAKAELKAREARSWEPGYQPGVS